MPVTNPADPKRVYDALLKAVVLDDIHEAKNYLRQGVDLNAEDQNGWNVLTIAANYGSVEAVRMLLGNGANVNKAGQFGVTPLMRAARRGDLGIARLLLENGADTDLRDFSGFSALDYAESVEKKEMAQLLLTEALMLRRQPVVRKQQKLYARSIKPIIMREPRP